MKREVKVEFKIDESKAVKIAERSRELRRNTDILNRYFEPMV